MLLWLYFRQHRGKVTGIAFSLNGDYLYSAGSLGSIALYDASDHSYHLLRLLGNTVGRGEHHGPASLTVSPDGRFVAFVGPSEFTVSVVDGRSLDEVSGMLWYYMKVNYIILQTLD